jgi:hypothetical protein
MKTPRIKNHRFIPLLFSILLLCACGSQQKTVLEGENTQTVDFSGSWELDYSQSDNIQAKLDSLVRDLRRQAARSQQGNMSQGPGSAMVIGPAGTANSGASIVGLAQMSELITRSSLLEVEQSEHKIKVKREENFALTCEFHAGQYHMVETPLGSESCGWNSHQLVFKIYLPEGLSIQHVMSQGPEGQKLNIATTVVSDQVSYPFTLNRVYQRFVPGNSGYRCKMTLTRGRVCTTEAL